MTLFSKFVFFLLVAFALTGVSGVSAAYAEEPVNHEHMDHGHMDHEDMADDDAPMEHVHKEATAEEKANIGVTEHLGENIPLDVTFTDSDGKTVTLKEIITKPTLIAPVYYSCPNVCNFLQSRLADIVPQMKMTAGKQFNLISVSFDENDTPQIAAAKKTNYLKAADGRIPPEGWYFLTGDKENIDRLMDALGFRFMRRGKDFAHPVAVMSVTPDGKIVRYLYGTDILSFEMTMAVVEAEKGTPGLSVKKLVAYCFSYDPQGKKYVFNTVRVSGFVVLFVIILFAAFLFFGGKKKKK
ncbi:MAG: SCO family protein [Deferribacterales bacterium]